MRKFNTSACGFGISNFGGKMRKEEKTIHFQKYIKQLKVWIEDFKSENTDLGHTY